MTRPVAELRAEVDRWKRRQREARAAHQPVEAITAAIIVQTLAYCLGESSSPAVRVKVG